MLQDRACAHQFSAAYRASDGGVGKSPRCQLSGESSAFHTSQVLLLGKAPRQEEVGNGRCLDWPVHLPSGCRFVDGKGCLDYCRLEQFCPRAILVELHRRGVREYDGKTGDSRICGRFARFKSQINTETDLLPTAY